jgi:7,8-dihydroneopterin aldolase/epimerase/oxygenase
VSVLVELAGLEIPGRHGVEDPEQDQEQPFVYDLELELEEPANDRIEDTVDYREVVELVRAVSESRQFQLLESIAAAVAEALLERFPLERARVRVRKPQVQLGVPVEHTAASVERSRV